MVDAAQLDIPPEHVSRQNVTCQEESTSGQMHGIGSGNRCSEPTKQNISSDVVQNELQESTSGQIHEISSESQCSEPTKQNIGCEVVRNELPEICKASNNADELLQSFSENVTENSYPEQSGLLLEDVSKNSQSGSGNAFTKPTAEGHHSSSEHIQNEPLQSSIAVSSCTINDQLQPFPGNVTKNSLTELLPHEDLGVNCQTSETSCSEQMSLEQINDFGFGTSSSEPAEEKHPFSSDFVQNEPLQTIIPVPSFGGNEQVQLSSENVNTASHNEQLRLPPEDVRKSSQNGSGNAFTKPTAEGHQHIQTELLQSSIVVSSCTSNDQLQPSPVNVTKNSLTERLELPHEELGVNCQTSKTSCSDKMSLEQINDFGFGTSSSEAAEEKHPLSSDFVQNESLKTITLVPSCGGNEQVQLISENVNMTSPKEQSGLLPEDVSKTCQTDKTSCSQQTTLEQINEFGSRSVHNEPSKLKDHTGSVPPQSDEVKASTAVSRFVVFELSGPSIEAMTNNSPIGHLEPPLEDSSKSPSGEQMEPWPVAVTQNSILEQSETPPKNASKDSSQLGCKDSQNSKSRKKSTLRSLIGSDRVLRSRTEEKPKALESSNNVATLESSNSVAPVSNGEEKKRKKKKKRQQERVIADEYSRIRKHLRYLLNRISYEQSLIDAYSGEGWKGFSLEKLKPEKELQRATSEILRRKLKIRDLFQRIDSLCAEGMLPESLFDSEGQIDSEDIFCAKCGSKDLSTDNDIILCDGACDRGFHQFCLEPPLLSEDIPPDDEGWLCPGCDCKVDCIDLLNDSQGTNLSITDSWEKVFPDAAAAASAGKNRERNHGLSSDDSDDNDYDPDDPETDEKAQAEESSSDESEYASADDEFEASKSNDDQYLGLPSDDSEDDDFNPDDPDDEFEAPNSNDDQYLGLPSDDSEDDDYNPDAPDVNDDVKQESSSSDFTSDSEDLAAALDDCNRPFENVDGSKLSSLEGSRILRGSGKQISKRGQKRSSLKIELLSLLESGPGQDDSAPVSGKRHIERLDYKRLHDETYGNVPSDSSDDEDWNNIATARKRKKGTGQVASQSPNGSTPTIKNGAIAEDKKHDLDENEHTSRRTPRRKSSVEDASNTSNKSIKGSAKPGSTSGRARSTSTYRRLGEATSQRLYKFFKENQYPDRATKESLAQELGLVAKQVSKWFENARHCVKAGIGKSASEIGTPLPQKNRKQLEQGDAVIGDSDHNGAQNKESHREDDAVTGCSGDVKDSELVTQESSRPKPITPNNRKRRRRSDSGASDLDPKIETPMTAAEPETSVQGGRAKTRRRKSVS